LREGEREFFFTPLPIDVLSPPKKPVERGEKRLREREREREREMRKRESEKKQKRRERGRREEKNPLFLLSLFPSSTPPPAFYFFFLLPVDKKRPCEIKSLTNPKSRQPK
jgi:hypothetical protein